MANWLEKIVSKAGSLPKPSQLPVVRSESSPLMRSSNAAPPPAKLPVASIIYAIAAAALFAISICFLIGGAWFRGAIIMLPAACLLGFSIHFIKNG